MFIQVSNMGIVRDIRTLSKNNRRLESNTLQIVRLQALFGKCCQPQFCKPKFTLCRFCQTMLKARPRFGNFTQGSVTDV